MIGNECTGDISAVASFLDTIEIDDDNWIKGTKGRYKICAKVFNEQSDFGVMNGRISKIQVCDTSQPHWGFEGCYMNYDRGWDIYPKDDDTREFVDALLEAFGDEKLSDDELSHYSVYGYYTEEDFEKGNHEHLLNTNYKSDAMEEAKAYLLENERNVTVYDVVKVISSDDEEIEIIHFND